jgi:hypothetical protein
MEVVVTYLKALFLFEGSEENYEANPLRITGFLAEIHTRDLCTCTSGQAELSGHRVLSPGPGF